MRIKTGGRTKGTPNKVTQDLRQWITDFIAGNTEQIQLDWKALEPKDRIVLFERLLKYTLPQLQATSLTTDFDRMTDDELNKVFEDLKKCL